MSRSPFNLQLTSRCSSDVFTANIVFRISIRNSAEDEAHSYCPERERERERAFV